MLLRRIQLQRFRNYAELDLVFPGNLNIFVGQNAQGKTNLLEAIYLLALGRSFRTVKDEDLVGWHHDFAQVKAEVQRQSGNIGIEIRLPRSGTKEVKIGGEKAARLNDLLGLVNVVVFSPDDLQLLKGSPSLRRRFLDAEIAQISAVYRHHFLRYHRVLRQRNNLLKAIKMKSASKDALDVWDAQLAADGSYVIAKRAETVRRLSQWAQRVYADLTAKREILTITYRPFFVRAGDPMDEAWEDRQAVEAKIYEAIKDAREDELARGVTMVGPQRDDLAFHINGADARHFASQGQQRSVVLASKLAELEFFNEEVGEYPILLLDDVMSELDDERRHHFMRIVSGKVNTFITTTNIRSFARDILDQASLYKVKSGALQNIDGL